VVGMGNLVNVQSQMAHCRFIPKLFPWNPAAFLQGEHPPSIHPEDLEDIREMQELAFARNIARNTSNTTVGGD
jgi:hypothetical protein